MRHGGNARAARSQAHVNVRDTMTLTLTDAQLLKRIDQGDETALLELHGRYASLVYSVAYRVLNDRMAAEEVTQDTFLRLWDKAHTYDSAKGGFVPWLLTITRRLAIDTFRRQNRDPMGQTMLIDGDRERWEHVLVGEHSDLRPTLIAVLYDLPEDQRQAIELAYFYGMSHSQIAEYLHLPLGTVKTRIRSGMERLRVAWAAEPSRNPNSTDRT